MESNEPVMTRRDRFQHCLTTEIIQGSLKPGDRLPTEREMAMKAEISRSAVHLALADLERMGFIKTNARHATYVADYLRTGTIETLNYLITYYRESFARSHVQELLDMRIAIEGQAVKVLLQKPGPIDLTPLTSDLDTSRRIAETEDEADLAASFFDFHHDICVLSGNFILSMLFNSFRSVTLTYWQEAIAFFGKQQCLSLEETFLDTLYTQDAEKAIRFLKDEFRIFSKAIEKGSVQ